MHTNTFKACFSEGTFFQFSYFMESVQRRNTTLRTMMFIVIIIIKKMGGYLLYRMEEP